MVADGTSGLAVGEQGDAPAVPDLPDPSGEAHGTGDGDRPAREARDPVAGVVADLAGQDRPAGTVGDVDRVNGEQVPAGTATLNGGHLVTAAVRAIRRRRAIRRPGVSPPITPTT